MQFHLMKHQNASHRELIFIRLLWVHIAIAVLAALVFWLWNGSPAESSEAGVGAVTVWDLAEPRDFATSQSDDTTAFREEDAGFSAHHRVPDHFETDGDNDLRPRLNVLAITNALLDDPDESNGNRQAAGRHVDSGGNFGIVELPMSVARSLGSVVPPRTVTVYYDDRGWVVAYLPADAPAAGIWRYDQLERDANDLEQNLLVLAINEVLAVAREDIPEIVDADEDTVGYYHWQHPEHNSFLLFRHESSEETSDPVRFVVPPTIENILASAAVLLTSVPPQNQSPATAGLMVDGNAAVTVRLPDRFAVSGFALERTDDATRLYEVAIVVDADTTATGAVMLVYTKPSS